MIERFNGREADPHYLGYFDCFNRGLYYEAHDVLEELWLPCRGGPDDRFYKGLIQLAGAFVHLQKDRLRPSAALFKLARANLELYRPRHRDLDMGECLNLIERWLGALEGANFASNPLRASVLPLPRIEPQLCA